LISGHSKSCGCRKGNFKATSDIIIHEEFAEVVLSRGATTKISIADVPLVSGFRWCKSKFGYAVRHEKKQNVWLHRVILGLRPEDAVEVDHRNRDTLDNRRENLRVCTRGDNCKNRGANKVRITRYKGVRKSGEGKRGVQHYAAFIKVDGKYKHLGVYSNIEGAARAYDVAAVEYFREFAFQNFPTR
jgi:hypothetical protein